MASCVRDGLNCTVHNAFFSTRAEECEIAGEPAAEPEPEARRPWREITHVGLRTPAVLLEVKDDDQRIRLETNEGDLILGKGKWVVLAYETWQTTLDKAFTAAQPNGRKDRRS